MQFKICINAYTSFTDANMYIPPFGMTVNLKDNKREI